MSSFVGSAMPDGDYSAGWQCEHVVLLRVDELEYTRGKQHYTEQRDHEESIGTVVPTAPPWPTTSPANDALPSWV